MNDFLIKEKKVPTVVQYIGHGKYLPYIMADAEIAHLKLYGRPITGVPISWVRGRYKCLIPPNLVEGEFDLDRLSQSDMECLSNSMEKFAKSEYKTISYYEIAKEYVNDAMLDYISINIENENLFKSTTI